MAKKLKVDLEQLSETITMYDKSYNDFESLIKTLSASVDALQNTGWKSAASEAFFQTYEETWKTNMQMHLKIIKHLKECLINAKNEYEALYESISSIGNTL